METCIPSRVWDLEDETCGHRGRWNQNMFDGITSQDPFFNNLAKASLPVESQSACKIFHHFRTSVHIEGLKTLKS